MLCTLLRTNVVTVELSDKFAEQWYLSEILRIDPFQKEKPCFQDNFDKIDIKYFEEK